jgi:hypothetical protein
MSIQTLDGRLLPDIAKEITDHLFNARPFARYLYGKKEKWRGGLEKRYNRIRAKGSNTAWLNLATTSLSGATTIASQLSASQFNLVGLRTPVSLTMEDILKSKSSELAIISETQNKMTQAFKEHFDAFAAGIADGAGTSNQPVGVVQMMTPGTIVGSVDPVLESDWAPATVTASTPLSGHMVVTSLITKAMDGNDKPNIGFINNDGFIACQAFASQQARLDKADGVAKLGFDKVVINDAEIVRDKDWAASNLTLLTDKYLHLLVDDVFDFRFSGFVTPVGEIYLTGDIRTAFMLTLESRRRQTGLTAYTL